MDMESNFSDMPPTGGITNSTPCRSFGNLPQLPNDISAVVPDLSVAEPNAPAIPNSSGSQDTQQSGISRKQVAKTDFEEYIPKSDEGKLGIMYAYYIQALCLERDAKLQAERFDDEMKKYLADITKLNSNSIEEFHDLKWKCNALQNEKHLRDQVNKLLKLQSKSDEWLEATKMREQLAAALDGKRHLLQTKGISSLSDQETSQLVNILKQTKANSVDLAGNGCLELDEATSVLNSTLKEEMSLFAECKELQLELEKLSVDKVANEIQLAMLLKPK